MTATPDTLAGRLRIAIGTRKLAHVAFEAKLSRREIQNLLNRVSKGGPRVDTVKALARVLGVSPGYLAFGEDNA